MAALTHLQEYWRAYLLNLIFVVLLLTSHTIAYGDEVSSGEFRLLGAEAPNSAQLLSTNVDVQVNGMLARVVLVQRFVNAGDQWVEGEYVFPLPADSAVDYMAMSIGERKIVGEIREREAAQRVYDAAKKAGKKASLVAQQRPNLFTSRVANIGPGESIEVELQYLETLHYDQGSFSLRVPTTLTPRYIPGQAFHHHADADGRQLSIDLGSGWARATDQVADAPLITPPMLPSHRAAQLKLSAHINAGLPLTEVKSIHHPATVEQQSSSHHIELEEGARLDRDVVLEWRPLAGQAPVAAAFGERLGDDYYYLVMVMPPQDLDDEAILPRETVFVIDTSGSMAGTSMVQARQALLAGLERLKPRDRFNVVEFNSHNRPLWQNAVEATPANLLRASRFVEGLDAGGGTEMKPALEFALAGEAPTDYLRQVVFITDGSVGNETELFELIRQRRGDSRVFTVGIGSAPSSHFMQQAAESGRGTFTYIGSQDEVARRITDLFHKLQSPLMSNIQLDYGATAAEQFPQTLPDLYAGEPLIVAARFKEQAPGYLLVNGQRNGQAFQQQLALPAAPSDKDVSKLWARRKLHQLYGDERKASDSVRLEDIKARISELAMDHRLMSKYTSFVALEQSPSRPARVPLRHEAIPNAMPAGNTMAIPVPAGALGLAEKWLVAVLAMGGLLLLHWRRIGCRSVHHV